MNDADAKRRLFTTLQGDEWFDTARDAWTALLKSSDADKLFLSWEWQHYWWRHFGKQLKGALAIVTVVDPDGTLLGIAPMFSRRSGFRRVKPATQLAPIGNVWRMSVGEVTEHADWIIRKGYQDVVGPAIRDFLTSGLAWDEILVAYASPQSHCCVELTELARTSDCYIRREHPLAHYSIDTQKAFEEYTRALGGNTRRRLLSRRALLDRKGTVTRVQADEASIDAHLDKLDHLSSLRWGKGLLPSVRRFYTTLSRELLRAGSLRFSILEVDGRPISALFDVVAGSATYNIRSAIDTDFDRRLSPGLLHLGYEIEDACRDPQVTRYALLAGQGKHSDFKRDIADVTETFTSFQLVRRAHEKRLYRLYDRLFRRD